MHVRGAQQADAVFSMALEDAGVVTTCDIRTIYDEDFDEVMVVCGEA